MNEADIFRQQVLNAVAKNGMGVTAAKFHEPILSGMLRFPGNVRRQLPGQIMLPKFIDIFHSMFSVEPTAANRSSVFLASSSLIFCKA